MKKLLLSLLLFVTMFMCMGCATDTSSSRNKYDDNINWELMESDAIDSLNKKIEADNKLIDDRYEFYYENFSSYYYVRNVDIYYVERTALGKLTVYYKCIWEWVNPTKHESPTCEMYDGYVYTASDISRYIK